jgi:CyaY protein
VSIVSEDDYERRAAPELRALLSAFDQLDEGDYEAELSSDILTIEFSDGTRFVINSHRAARQIWMAANRSAWHFDWHPEASEWRTTKSGDELWSTLERVVSEKLGKPLALARPRAS